MGKPVGTWCVQKFNCKWLRPGQMTSFYTLSDILRAILSCNKEVCCVVFIFEWRIALEGLDRWIGFQFVCINRLDGAVASADRVTFGERFFLTASFVVFLVHSVPPLILCVEKVTQKWIMCVSKSTQKCLFLGVCKNKYPNPVVFGKIWERKNPVFMLVPRLFNIYNYTSPKIR